jgi:predicted PurR-regulated permease PerM
MAQSSVYFQRSRIMKKSVLAAAVATLLAIALMVLTAGEVAAQGPDALPFSNNYRRPNISPYNQLQANLFNPLASQNVYQQMVLPQLQQQQQQIEQMRQSKQIRGLGNQVQQIQRSTTMRQVDEMIRPTGHASTYQNLSHFYPQR